MLISHPGAPAIDTHAHLDEMEDLDGIVARARQAGVTAIVSVGSNHLSNERTLLIAERFPSYVLPALGLHPWEIGPLGTDGIEAAIRHIEENIGRAAGVGEVGLDYDKRVLHVSPKELQHEVLRRLLALAERHGKPVMLHSRYAWKDAFELVTQAGVQRVVFHWYTGFSSVLRDIIHKGYFISATPAAEYHNEHQRAIKEVPLENLLLETDSPVTYGRETRYRAEPADVARSLQAAARLRGIPPEQIADQTTRNAAAFLGLPAGGLQRAADA